MATSTTITIHIPRDLRIECDGARELFLSASSVRAALAELERLRPTLYRNICDETGTVRRHLNLFVNSAHVRERQGLETALIPGDTLYILPSVSGG
ncbi:MAG: MoaD/ThiS family protein [Planctomycetaceae bacterium]